MGGIDAISHAIATGLIGFAAYPILGQRFGYLPATIIFPILGLLCVAYDIFLLTLIGRFKSRTEFVLRNGAIIRKKDGVELQPTFLRQETEYSQTDAFLGYSFYGLGLHDGSGELARNVYLSEEAMEKALQEILHRPSSKACYYVDLTLVFRKSEFVWWTYPFPQANADILCGELFQVSDECRNWWRQWLRPNFTVDGFEIVSAEEMNAYYNQLKMGYPERFPAKEENLHTLTQLTHWPLPEYDDVNFTEAERIQRRNDRLRCHWTILETILQRAPGPFEMMTTARLTKEQFKIAPNGGNAMRGGADAELRFFQVTLEPH